MKTNKWPGEDKLKAFQKWRADFAARRAPPSAGLEGGGSRRRKRERNWNSRQADLVASGAKARPQSREEVREHFRASEAAAMEPYNRAERRRRRGGQRPVVSRTSSPAEQEAASRRGEWVGQKEGERGNKVGVDGMRRSTRGTLGCGCEGLAGCGCSKGAKRPVKCMCEGLAGCGCSKTAPHRRGRGLGAMRDVTNMPKERADLMRDIKEADARRPNQSWAREWYDGNAPAHERTRSMREPYVPPAPGEAAAVEEVERAITKAGVKDKKPRKRGKGGKFAGFAGKGSCSCDKGLGGIGKSGKCSCLGGSPETDEHIRMAFVASDDGDCARVEKHLFAAEKQGANVSLHRKQLMQDCRVGLSGQGGHASGKRGKTIRMNKPRPSPTVHLSAHLDGAPAKAGPKQSASEKKAEKKIEQATAIVEKLEAAVDEGSCKKATTLLAAATKAVSALPASADPKATARLEKKVKGLFGKTGGVCMVPGRGKK